MHQKNISIRNDYNKGILDEKQMNENPFQQFNIWFQEAIDVKVYEPHAMVLSTVGEGSLPSSRVVLLRSFSDDAFQFYTNYESKKGRDIWNNPMVSILFFWKEMERQVRIEGTAVRMSEEASTAYFKTRPRQSQLGAWASAQSSILESRASLENQFIALEKEYEGKEIPKPPYWGGYSILPTYFEFWQGGLSRLHDRIYYKLLPPTDWERGRLNP